MGTVAVLATGPSMNQDTADFVRGKCTVIVISDAYKLAPDAAALVSNDRAWWKANPDAIKFAGRKFCGQGCPGVERLNRSSWIPNGSNSGLRGMQAALEYFGANLILLCGFDMHGTHYFGLHPAPLKNTQPKRFAAHIRQFDRWRGCPVINCTPGSAITKFPFGGLDEALRSG